MKITLRKANALQHSINETLKGLDIKSSVDLNEFQTDPEAEINDAATQFKAALARRGSLLNALYEIRKEVSTSNVKHGIDSKLADVARYEKDIQFFASLAKTNVRETASVIVGKLNKIRDRKEDMYSGYRDSGLVTSVFTASDVESFRNQVLSLKKQKQTVQDELLELNVRTEIKVSDTTLATLTAEGIV